LRCTEVQLYCIALHRSAVVLRSYVTAPRTTIHATNHSPTGTIGNTEVMERWTCPNCNRVFGKKNQSHLTCEPAVSLEEYFEVARPFEKPIFEAVNVHLQTLDDVIIDPLGIGILLKNGPMFAELRPKTKWVALGFSLPRKLKSGRLSRKVSEYGRKYFHVINVDDPVMIDQEVCEWLTEAYHLAGGTLSNGRAGDQSVGGDGMVPDDIDIEF